MPCTPWFDLAATDDPEACRALVFLARDEFAEPLDLVAWDGGHRLTLLYARAGLLGLEQLRAARLESPPLMPVFDSALAWLRAERRGLVIVDDASARTKVALTEAYLGEGLLFTSEAVAARIAAIVKQPKGKIFVRVRQHASGDA